MKAQIFKYTRPKKKGAKARRQNLGALDLPEICVHVLKKERPAAVKTLAFTYCAECARATFYRRALGLILDLGLGPRSKLARAYRALSGPHTAKG